MPNQVIKNYLQDTTIPLDKRKFAVSELEKGVSEEKVAGAITEKYGDKYGGSGVADRRSVMERRKNPSPYGTNIGDLGKADPKEFAGLITGPIKGVVSGAAKAGKAIEGVGHAAGEKLYEVLTGNEAKEESRPPSINERILESEDMRPKTNTEKFTKPIGEFATTVATTAGAGGVLPKVAAGGGTLGKIANFLGRSTAMTEAAVATNEGRLATGGELATGAAFDTALLGMAGLLNKGKGVGESLYEKAFPSNKKAIKKAMKESSETVAQKAAKERLVGTDKKIFNNIQSELVDNETVLQASLNDPKLAKVGITRSEIADKIDDLVEEVVGTPSGDQLVKLNVIDNVLKEFPNEASVANANILKRSQRKLLGDKIWDKTGDATEAFRKRVLKRTSGALQNLIEEKTSQAGIANVKEVNKRLGFLLELEDVVLENLARAKSSRSTITFKDLIFGAGGFTAFGSPIGAVASIGAERAAQSTLAKTLTASALLGISEAIEKGIITNVDDLIRAASRTAIPSDLE